MNVYIVCVPLEAAPHSHRFSRASHSNSSAAVISHWRVVIGNKADFRIYELFQLDGNISIDPAGIIDDKVWAAAIGLCRPLAVTTKTHEEIKQAICDLKKTLPQQYHEIRNNCQNFALKLLERILGKKLRYIRILIVNSHLGSDITLIGLQFDQLNPGRTVRSDGSGLTTEIRGLLAVPNKPSLCQFKKTVNQRSVDREKEGSKEHSGQLSSIQIPWHEYSQDTIYSDVRKLQSTADDLHGHWIAKDSDGEWGILAAMLMEGAASEVNLSEPSQSEFNHPPRSNKQSKPWALKRAKKEAVGPSL
ncbi:hypothetical protein B0H16DRAFT_1467708 [Mycena metata]|uniref:PPPDE domain-containing protein n=1 Tax=Mycena metata TaxID=1033252 RepID=A0AAD7I4M7_9AGAR|nr:hypothetical protein B0H16DRAFT_1467708 [Mycena metata]